MQNRSGARHRFVPIDGWPGKLQLMVMVPHAQVGTNGDNTLSLVPGVSLFSGWHLAQSHLLADFGSYVYGGVQPYQDQEMLSTLWSPAISATARLTAVDTQFDTMNYSWPPVLIDLLVVKDGANLATRERYVDGINDRSTVKVQTYFSNTPWTRRECETDLPKPSRINGQFYGLNVTFPECLHPELVMISRTNDNAEVFDCVPSESANRTGNEILFPATNQVDWADHIVDIKTADLGGLHRRVVTTVLAPAMPDITYA